jgi:hypothetical protein
MSDNLPHPIIQSKCSLYFLGDISPTPFLPFQGSDRPLGVDQVAAAVFGVITRLDDELFQFFRGETLRSMASSLAARLATLGADIEVPEMATRTSSSSEGAAGMSLCSKVTRALSGRVAAN